MRNLAVIDEQFDGERTPDYHLSIRMGEQSLVYAILDTRQRRYLALKQYWFPGTLARKDQADLFRKTINAEGFLSRPFKSIYFNYLTPLAVLVPEPLFRQEEAGTYLRLGGLITPMDRIFFRRLPGIASYVVFPVPADLTDQVNFMLDRVQFLHQSCPLILDAQARTAETPECNLLSAELHAGFMDLVAFKSGHLLLSNSYPVRNSEEVCYFVLNVIEQLGLSADETHLVITGLVEKYPESIEILKACIRNSHTGELPAAFSYSRTFGELPAHQFTQLINLARCES